MNKVTRFLAIIMLFIIAGNNLFGQDEEKESPFSIGVDLYSRYIWRGINLGGSSPSIQPYVEIGFGTDDHAFAFGAWGAYSLSGAQTGQEADLYLSYTVKEMFTLTVTDYFFPDETLDSYKYFNYRTDWEEIDAGADQTGHVIEASLGFNGTESFPVSVLFAMNVWGADARKYEEQGGAMVPVDKIVMSKYLEIGYSADIRGTGMDVFAGFSLDNPGTDIGEPAGFYGQESAGLINLGLTVSHELQISDRFNLPVSGSLITNPEAGNIFIIFGVSF